MTKLPVMTVEHIVPDAEDPAQQHLYCRVIFLRCQHHRRWIICGARHLIRTYFARWPLSLLYEC